MSQPEKQNVIQRNTDEEREALAALNPSKTAEDKLINSTADVEDPETGMLLNNLHSVMTNKCVFIRRKDL